MRLNLTVDAANRTQQLPDVNNEVQSPQESVSRPAKTLSLVQQPALETGPEPSELSEPIDTRKYLALPGPVIQALLRMLDPDVLLALAQSKAASAALMVDPAFNKLVQVAWFERHAKGILTAASLQRDLDPENFQALKDPRIAETYEEILASRYGRLTPAVKVGAMLAATLGTTGTAVGFTCGAALAGPDGHPTTLSAIAGVTWIIPVVLLAALVKATRTHAANRSADVETAVKEIMKKLTKDAALSEEGRIQAVSAFYPVDPNETPAEVPAVSSDPQEADTNSCWPSSSSSSSSTDVSLTIHAD
jgi:hypothetical protein